MEPLAERSLLGSPGAPSSLDDDESVLMRPSQFLPRASASTSPSASSRPSDTS